MRSRTLTVSDLMVTAVVTIRSNAPVSSARSDMEVGAFRHLPVVDDRGRLVGVLSDRDLLRALSLPKQGLVAEIMTRAPMTVRADSPAHVAATMMVDHKIGCVPVIGEDDQLIGLLTETDFLDVARRALLSLPLEP